jgi:hypothetical protein
MKKIEILCMFGLYLCASGNLFAQKISEGKSGNIPLPSPAQLHWQQKERMMFLCLDPCTSLARACSPCRTANSQ